MSDDRFERRDQEHEARLIEEGRQAIREGRYVDDADLDAWLDALDENPDLPIPLAHRGRL
jgi:hypothetical protein